jgi:hypothetical protein
LAELAQLQALHEWVDALEVASTVPGSRFAGAVAERYERATS